MPAYATEYVQLERICPGCVEELVRNGRIYQYHFRMLEAKRGKILGVICDNSIRDMCHMEFVQAFLEEPGSCYTKKEIEAKKSCSLCCRKKWTCSIIQERN